MKKPAPLSSHLVAIKGSAAPVDDMPTRSAAAPAKEEESGLAPLNFRVSAEFRREFKTYAAAHDLKLNKLLALELPGISATARRLTLAIGAHCWQGDTMSKRPKSEPKLYFAATRFGKKQITVPLDPPEHKRLKHLAIELERTVEDLMREALGDLLAKYPEPDRR